MNMSKDEAAGHLYPSMWMNRRKLDIVNALPSVDMPVFKAAAKAVEAEMKRRKRFLAASQRARVASGKGW
jgi:hypothetical protein